MKLPRKISPDPIREAIVEIRYDSNLPQEVLVGMLFHALDNTYSYGDMRPSREGEGRPAFLAGIPQEITLPFRQTSFFYTDSIVTEMRPGSLAFTCRDKYIGWEKYKTEIEKVVSAFAGLEHNLTYTRVGMRYINDFAGIDLSQNTCFEYSFGLPDVRSHAYSFRAEFFKDHYRVVLQLAKRALEGPAPEEGGVGVANSVMDIDVIWENLQLSSLEEIGYVLADVHQAGKEIFYSVLKPDFLEKLNPEYD